MSAYRQRQQGIALVTALLIVAIIAAVATSVGLGQQVWLRQTENLTQLTQAEAFRRGMQAAAGVMLKKDGKDAPQTDNLTEDWAKATLAVSGGVAKISDAQARFNLNNVVDDKTRQVNKEEAAVFRNLLTADGLDPALTEALIDWIDPNPDLSAGGAEDLEYQNENPPRRAANRPLTSASELRMIKGFNKDKEALNRLLQHVIALPKKTPVNVNTASREVIAALANIPVPQAEQIVQLAKTQPFKNKGELDALLKLAPDAKTAAYDVTTSYFIVTVKVSIGNMKQTTESLIERTTGGSSSTKVLWYRQPPLEIPDEDKDKDKT
ncbi:MAG: type II secretion system minor pseudopilin GspK [Gammaproteobacteria bacterium]|nr:type II secretion system minor pseudopilin GspK [Gammaproteobacteria bacterium]